MLAPHGMNQHTKIVSLSTSVNSLAAIVVFSCYWLLVVSDISC